MFKKIVLAAVAASTSVLFFAACGGNDCQDAADRIAAKAKSCNIQTSSSSSSSTGSSSDCTAEAGKAAQAVASCTEAATCDALTGKDLTGATNYLKCIADAAGASSSTTSGSTGSSTSASTGTGG